jgi:hypothetical protein
VSIYAQSASGGPIPHQKKKEPRGPTAARPQHPTPRAVDFSASRVQTAVRAPRVDLCAISKRRPDSASSKKENRRGPGAAPPQHEQFFDSQPRGFFVFFPYAISDITAMHTTYATTGGISSYSRAAGRARAAPASSCCCSR